MADYTLVGIQAGNVEDIGMMVEMESLYLQSVAYNNLNYARIGNVGVAWGVANFLLGT